jgi:signal transduction histidine kinase
VLRLTALEGPDSSAVYALEQETIGVGTAADNEVHLTDRFVSRYHGRFTAAGIAWHYADLGSKNGSAIRRGSTRISVSQEDGPVEVQPGDLLLIGRSVLQVGEAGPAEPVVVASREASDLTPTSALELTSLEGLKTAYRLGRQMGLAGDPDEVLDEVLRSLLETFADATHAIVLLVEKGTGRPRRQVARVRGEEGRSAEAQPISTTLIARVLQRGTALLLRDAPAELAGSASVAAVGLKSTMCAPLWTGDETVGLVQVDNRAGGAAFTAEDLDRLCLIAGEAAPAIVGSELREAEQRNRLLRDLSAMVTHDLAGPLSSVTGLLRLLAGEPLSQEQHELVEVALAGSEWMGVLVAGILDVARMEAGRMEPRREPVAIGSEVEQALLLLDHHLRQKRMRVEVSVAPNLPTILGDADLLRRVLLNLVANAVRFSSEGGTLELVARLEEDGSRMVVSVRDQGPGIPLEQQALIFDKFAQLPGGRRAASISVGLGLAFCRLAVEAHGGRIWVESEAGKGSCFSFSLPCQT